MRSAAKRVEQSLLVSKHGFLFVPNMSKLGKSELASGYPHSILMQEPKDMREKNIEPEKSTGK
jgi:hypothetical protein